MQKLLVLIFFSIVSLGLAEVIPNPFVSRTYACFVSFQRNGKEMGFIHGGLRNGKILSDAWILDFDANVWSSIPATLPTRFHHTCLFNESLQSIILLGGTEEWDQVESTAAILLQLDDWTVVTVKSPGSFDGTTFNYFMIRNRMVSVSFYYGAGWILQFQELNETNFQVSNQTELALNVTWIALPEGAVALGDRIFSYGGLFPNTSGTPMNYVITGDFIMLDTVHGTVSQVSDTNRPYLLDSALTAVPSQSGRGRSFLLSGGCFNLSQVPAICTHANTDVYQFDEDDLTWRVIASNVIPVEGDHPAFYSRNRLYIVGQNGTEILHFGPSSASSSMIPSSPLALILGCIFGSAILAIIVVILIALKRKQTRRKSRNIEGIPLL